ncbi:MAG: nucleotidyl transferase AbiEii/AbiGii toxin family protein [Elusimicrobia bacterium CG_4_9_14_3_um_filter_62_55]|nr:MAG: hypothetical protein COR54_10800 [Elusimicrobia bacterium CG22_combo_CG10-13_8_21_14_all_63_91]PJA14801.1 MAG: nucleotidyl transferase AbiEii/AbiGii toxin family protein [Elusimicrobia bacterium CG_4_10_14_0_2_um_filter_63_34]PJB26470.1 MAG: nucleotidyl transferase AbiEii/AbiGii toxin family protein [Elusimicrobia bacterium CG_4_9_14_3_um_filter_62_55]
MDKIKKYATPTAFRRALEDRLKLLAKAEGLDIQRLLREVAFDRLLARLFSGVKAPWVLKGGYALELRIKEARVTRDIDLVLRESLGKERGEPINEAIFEVLRSAAQQDMEDFFSFVIGGVMQDLDAAPYGGARFPVEARMDGRSFVKFHIDIAAGDVVMTPLDTIEGRDWLKFAGIPAAKFPTISREQHFAEKVHAYTVPRPSVNSRVRDMVDMLLLIRSSPKLDLPLVKKAIDATFKRRKTHAMPDILNPPPADWKQRYTELALQCDLSEDLDGAFRLLDAYLKSL